MADTVTVAMLDDETQCWDCGRTIARMIGPRCFPRCFDCNRQFEQSVEIYERQELEYEED